MNKLKNTENVFFLGLFLGIVGSIAALALAYLADLTKQPIADMKTQAVNNALRQVLPEFDNDPGQNIVAVKSADGQGYDVVFYGALRNGKLVGIAGQSVSMRGYSGKIRAIVGLELDGRIRTVGTIKDSDVPISAVLVTEHGETPGLGAAICDRARKKTIFNMFDKPDDEQLPPPNFILDQYAGSRPDKTPWKTEKDGGTLKYVTGATISSNAIAEVTYRIANTFAAERAKIIAALAVGSANVKDAKP